MENWGGITFFESRLLFDPADESGHRAARHLHHHRPRDGAPMVRRSRHHGAGGTISGSTRASRPGWQTKAAEHFHPQWQSWLNGNGQKQFAMALDARRTSHPIQQPIANESEAMIAFDGITYNKGQALIRMLENYLGEDGVPRRHPRLHGRRTPMATPPRPISGGRWSASGHKPVTEIAAVLYRTGRRAADLGRNRLQRRCAAADACGRTVSWSRPARRPPCRRATGKYRSRSGRCGMRTSADVVLLQGSTEIPAGSCGEAIKVNLGDIGYYRVEYGAGELRRAGEGAAADVAGRPRQFPRRQLGDGAGRPRRAVDPISPWSRMIGVDDRRPVWDQVITAFTALNRLSRDRPERPALQSYARAKLRPVFDRLGWDGSGSGDDDDTLLRGSLIWTLGELGDEADPGRGEAAVRRLPAAIRNRCRRRCAIPSPISSASRPIARSTTRCWRSRARAP